MDPRKPAPAVVEEGTEAAVVLAQGPRATGAQPEQLRPTVGLRRTGLEGRGEPLEQLNLRPRAPRRRRRKRTWGRRGLCRNWHRHRPSDGPASRADSNETLGFGQRGQPRQPGMRHAQGSPNRLRPGRASDDRDPYPRGCRSRRPPIHLHRAMRRTGRHPPPRDVDCLLRAAAAAAAEAPAGAASLRRPSSAPRSCRAFSSQARSDRPSHWLSESPWPSPLRVAGAWR